MVSDWEFYRKFLPCSEGVRNGTSLDKGKPTRPNILHNIIVATLWNGNVFRQWLIIVEQALDILNESVHCWLWPGCIIPNVPDVAKILLIFQVKVWAGNHLQEQNVSGNDSRTDIIHMQIKRFSRSVVDGSYERTPQVPTSQKENLG